MTGNDRRADTFQIKPLAPGKNGCRKLLHVGGGEEKFDVLRRLFQRLEQRVKGTGREHVHLVDKIHFVPSTGGHVLHVIDNDLAHLVHLCVGGCVEFQNIQRVTTCNLSTGITPTARRNRRLVAG